MIKNLWVKINKSIQLLGSIYGDSFDRGFDRLDIVFSRAKKIRYKIFEVLIVVLVGIVLIILVTFLTPRFIYWQYLS